MPCGISISSVVSDPITGDLHVVGSYNGVGQRKVKVEVTCGSQTSSGFDGITPGTTWTIHIPGAGCACGQPATVTVSDPSDPTCTVTLITNVLCCCPTAITSPTYGLCTGTNELVTFDTTVTISSPCTYTLRRDYGDGAFGGTYPLTGPGTFTLPQEQHTYAPGTYTSTVEVLSPQGCGSVDVTQVIAQCAPCHTMSFIAAWCELLEFSFLLSGSVGLVLTITLILPIGVTAMIVGIAVAALALFLLLKCDQCACDPGNKLLAQIFFIAGINLVMFIPPNPSPVTGGPAFAFAVLFLTLGYSNLKTWYMNNKATCPLTQCDFLCTVGGLLNTRSCTNISILATAIIYAITNMVLSPLGLFFALVLAIAIGAIVYNLLVLPCKKMSSTCQ